MLKDEPPAKRQALLQVSDALGPDEIELLTLPEVPHTSQPQGRGTFSDRPDGLEAPSVDRDQLQLSHAPNDVQQDHCEFFNLTT